jgi:protein-S-isoprenylcysteine O-methyltransferase Ste14
MIGAPTRSRTTMDRPAPPRGFGRVRHQLTSRVLPVTALAGLALWQLGALVSALRELNVDPGWIRLGECLRIMLYVFFLCFPIAAFLTHEPPRSRDGRLVVTCAAITASFLLAGLALLVPSGPEFWHPPPQVMEVALAVTMIGAALAVVSAQSLGASFSFGPQGRALVVRGPYRLVRHPIYLAELLMILGVTVVDPRLVPILGALCVAGLQLVRIRAEEQLLRSTFPGFNAYAAVTRHRLIPLVW